MSTTTLGTITLTTTPQQAREVSACGTEPVDVLDRAEADRRAALLKALADPVRLQLLSIISASPGQEACVCDMTEAVQVSQPTVSHHLKTLVDAGLLTRQRRGSWAWFRLDVEGLAAVRGFLA
ncbi:metalloregulator ArsR/SmtB family transcription factor [Terrabacter carboxydivorans]|uniref:HTH arsR-type domain-containing protein n=1 Tax=Terrabacter carboxydivorans TaxID=619730 RepID=A0ABP5XV20_9MICO